MLFCIYILFIIVFEINSYSLQNNFSKIEGNFKKDSHLNFEHIKKLCSNSVAICKSNDTNICATRLYNGNMEYRNYENSCYLFINNMCHNYGKEFSIVSAESCSEYFKYRRREAVNEQNLTSTAVNGIETILSTTKKVTPKPIMRVASTMSTLYDIDTAFDDHICPMSCPDVYSPVCVGVNRGHGLYYKFYTFVNHCAGDLYYCKNWMEFSPPPDEQEMVKSSPLSWSYCAANRYIQFARFTEMTSSMGHYGWLAGDYKPTHIMDRNERMPGYGRK